jgi:hypothetical protein
MVALKKYQKAILTILEDFVSTPYSHSPTVEKQLIADVKRNRYQAIVCGWESEEQFVCTTFLHFEIKNGKIWIQQNWTERLVATELVEQGVPKSKIVLGYLPPIGREISGYAVS